MTDPADLGPGDRLLARTLDERDAARDALAKGNPIVANAAAEVRALNAKIAELERRSGMTTAPSPKPITPDTLKGLSVADVRARWPEVKAALRGARPPGPLTDAELADLEKLDPKTINEHWPQIAAELKRRGAK